MSGRIIVAAFFFVVTSLVDQFNDNLMDDGNEEQNKFFASIIKEKDMEEWKNWQTKDFLSTSPESLLEDS